MPRIAIVFLIGLWAWAGETSRLMADQKQAEEVLKGKGLAKRMSCFCLAEEAELSKLLLGRQAESGKRKKAVDAAQAKANAAQAALDELGNYGRQSRQEYDALNVQLQSLPATSPQRRKCIDRMNYLAAMSQALPGRVQQAESSLQEARTAAAQQREAFIQYVLQLRQKFDALTARYEQLAGDAEVKKALEEYNQALPRACTLGPLKATGDALKKLEREVITDEIPIHPGAGQLWHVFVTINDKPPLEIAIDTGASLISLPYKYAQAVGLTPTSDAPQVTLELADGKKIQAQLMVADTVRAGKFTVKNVKCAVLPQDLPQATPLLGLSYLNNFTFKIDKTRGLLVMARLEESGKADRGSTAHGGRAEKRPSGDRPASGGSPKAETKPEPAGTPAEQLAKLLALDGQPEASPQGNLVYKTRDGQSVAFRPSKRGPAKTLQERFGDPDEIHKIPAPRVSGDESAAAKDAPPWKVWTWGTVKVLVDESGTTRYFSVSKE